MVALEFFQLLILIKILEFCISESHHLFERSIVLFVYQTSTCVRSCYRHNGLRGQLQDFLGFPGGSDGKVSACNAGDLGSIPGLGRSPGEGNGSPLHYSPLESSMDREAWWVTVHGVAQSWTRRSTEWWTHINTHCFTSWRFIKHLRVSDPVADTGDSEMNRPWLLPSKEMRQEKPAVTMQCD